MTEKNEFVEDLTSATSRIKADIENCYNLTMIIRMNREGDSKKLELLRELAQKLYKVWFYIDEVIHNKF